MNNEGGHELTSELKQFIELYLKLPFHNWLGLTFSTLSYGSKEAEFKLHMKPEFIGNEFKGMVSGGVIAAVMDVTCGLATLLAMFDSMTALNDQQKMDRLIHTSTVNLHLDYLKPASGDLFICRTTMLRLGQRVAVAKAHLYNQQDLLIAVGTGTFLLGR